MNILITGGSGCGKSTYAEKLIGSMPREDRVYIATMQVYDEESARRVARHRRQRADLGFETVEQPKSLGDARVKAGSVALLEDLPNLLANEMFDGGDPDRILKDLKALSAVCRHLVVVTNDVFSDGVAYPDLTDEYLRRLARLNAGVAAHCDCVVEVVYAIPVPLKGNLPCF